MMAALFVSDVRRIVKSMDFAARKHKAQTRKGDGTPYINHPIGVAWILWDEGQIHDAVTIIAGALHDTVEDTDTTLEEIREEFGDHVALVVKEVTDDKSLPKEERKRLQVIHASEASYRAQDVKLADKLYNLRDLLKVPPKGWSEERIMGYFVWSKAVVDAIEKSHRGASKLLLKSLQELFDTATFQHGEKKGEKIMPENTQDALEAYYSEMSVCKN